MFSTLEGRLLQPWTAFPRKEKGVISEISIQFLKIQSALFLTEGAYFFLTEHTDEQNTQHSKQVVAPPPSPPPKGGAWSPRYPYKKDVGLMLSLNHIYNGWSALCTLYAGGLLWARNVRQKAPWTLWPLWEKKLPSKLHASHLIEWVRSISHRKTQKNRTHKAPQRH